MLVSGPALAVNLHSVWDGGSGVWDTNVLKWNGGGKWQNNVNATFGGASGTVTLGEDIAVKRITFAASGYTITGGYELDIKDGFLLQTGVSGALVSVDAIKLSKDQDWTVTDAGALLTVSSPVALEGKALTVSGAGDAWSSGGISGLGSLSKSGSGTFTLTGVSSYGGPTAVTDGTLMVNGGVSSSPITVSVEGTLAGSGTVAGVTLGIGGILSPGDGVGRITTGNVTVQGGSYYNWQIADATGAAGTGFDHVASTGTLTFATSSLSRAKFNLWSLSAPGVNGASANFDENLSYDWEVANFGSIVNFDPAHFIIVRGPAEGAGGFQGAIDGTFSLTSDGSRLILHYVPGGAGAGPAVWTNGTGLWSVGANWLTGSTPTIEARPVFFAGTGGTSTHDTPLASVSELRFLADATGSYVVDGAPLLLGAAGIINESAHAQTIALDLTLTADSIIVTHTALVSVTGDIDTAGHMLVIDGDHDTAISGVISGAGGVHKLDFGTLTLTGASTYAGLTDVLFGTLRLDGSISGEITVGAFGTLSGRGSFGGKLELDGVLAPGDSPGVLTQAGGNAYFNAGARFEVEIGGLLAGSGDGFHDRFNIASGACEIDPGVTLVALPWDDAGGSVFVPSRADVFTVLDARFGIYGGFADLANPGHSQWLLYDNNATGIRYGNLYGTGLLGTQTFADYGLSGNQRAVGQALHAAAVTASPSSTEARPAGFIDSSTVEGRVALAVLAGASLDAFSAESYLLVLDHALDTNRRVIDGALVSQPLARTGDWSLGFTQERVMRDRLTGPAILSERRYSSDSSVLRLAYDAGSLTTVGLVLGHTRATMGALDSDGQTYGLTLVQRPSAGSRWSFDAGVAWSDLEFGGSRSQVLGTSVNNGITLENVSVAARDVPVRALGYQANIRLSAYRGEKLSVGLVAGAVHERARTEAFAESGNGALLAVAGAVRESTKAVAGLNLTYLPRPWLGLALTAGYEREVGSDGVTLGAALAGETFTVTDNPIGRDTAVVGLRVSSRINNSLFLQVGAEIRDNAAYDLDRRLSLNLTVRF